MKIASGSPACVPLIPGFLSLRAATAEDLAAVAVARRRSKVSTVTRPCLCLRVAGRRRPRAFQRQVAKVGYLRVEKTQKGRKSRKSLKTANLRKLVRGNSQQVTVKKKNLRKTFPHSPPPRLLEIVFRASKRGCFMNRNRKKQQPWCQRPHLDSGL